MKKRRHFAALCVVGSLLVVTKITRAQDPFLLGTQGGVDVWSLPQPSPGSGFDATKIYLKTDPSHKMVTFENLLIDGAVHQLWAGNGFQGPNGNAQGPPRVGPLYRAEWGPFDSHLLVTQDMVGGEGPSYPGIFETNDGSTGDLGLPAAGNGAAPAMGGIGPIRMQHATDAFFFEPPYQRDEVEFAYIVAPTVVAAHGGFHDFGVTLTLGVLGEGIIDSGQPGGAFFDALPIAGGSPPPPDECHNFPGDICFDFDADDEGAILIGDSKIVSDGGNPGGYLSITDAVNGQRGTVILPDVGGGGQFVLGGRTGGANSVHDVDNIEASVVDDKLSIRADFRIGGGTANPADGFSFNFVRPGDPVLAGDGNGWAGIGLEDNLPEEGTTTGISIGFDEWQSGPAPTNDAELLTNDVVGISLRVDGVLLGQAILPTKNGALDDPTSLQTGMLGEELGWATLTITAPNSGNVSPNDVVITWKGHLLIPEPASGLMALMSLLGLGMLRRQNDSGIRTRPANVVAVLDSFLPDNLPTLQRARVYRTDISRTTLSGPARGPDSKVT